MIEIAIVGAGPYGLSIAAHFRGRGIPFRVFGRPMDSWLNKMPKGMHLKSDGFASDLYDPNGELTLKRFCSERGIEYSDVGIPVALDTFCSYGLAFQKKMVPELEDKSVVRVDRDTDGFRLTLDDGEVFVARCVILAIGITHFQYVPEIFRSLPPQFLSHSAAHHDLEGFRGRKVAVVGGGSSATDLAGLLHEVGAEVVLVARQTTLKFHGRPVVGKPRSTWERIRSPQSGLGPGLKSRFYANSPLAFHLLPERVRLDIVRTHLGPSGGWFIKDRVIGQVPLYLGCTPERADVQGGLVRMALRNLDGTQREIETEHVIAATGYKVDLDRVKLLSDDIRSNLETVENTPVLSSAFETSVPNLYFAGVAAANSFGPVMRFAFGAGFTARHLTKCIASSQRGTQTSIPVSGAVPMSR